MRQSLSVLVLVNLGAASAQAAAVPVEIGVLTCTIAAGVVDKAGGGGAGDRLFVQGQQRPRGDLCRFDEDCR